MLRPIFSLIEFSKTCRLISLDGLRECFLVLKILTKFSDCLTERFFSIILFATNSALSRPTKIFACPAVSFWVSINFKTVSGRPNSLKKLAIWLLLFPINFATFS